MPPQGPPAPPPVSYVIVMVMLVMIIWLVAQLPTFAARDIIIRPSPGAWLSPVAPYQVQLARDLVQDAPSTVYTSKLMPKLNRQHNLNCSRNRNRNRRTGKYNKERAEQ